MKLFKYKENQDEIQIDFDKLTISSVRDGNVLFSTPIQERMNITQLKYKIAICEEHFKVYNQEIEGVVRYVSKLSGISLQDMQSKSRKEEIIAAMQASIALLKIITKIDSRNIMGYFNRSRSDIFHHLYYLDKNPIAYEYFLAGCDRFEVSKDVVSEYLEKWNQYKQLK